jgi:hypothetical protein
MTFALIPVWLEYIRIGGALLVWVVLSIQLWSLYHARRQYLRQEADEQDRRERWKRDMDDAAKLREEAFHLRAQAEIALAQARQQMNGRH